MMEFLTPNLIATISGFSAFSGPTDTVAYLFDRTKTRQYSSAGKNADGTAEQINFDLGLSATGTFDTIVLENLNWKGFAVYKNQITSTALISSFATNSETSLFIRLASATNFGEIIFVATSTMAANEEKKVGQIWLATRNMEFERNPNADGYKPVETKKQIQHDMADGGVSFINFSTKFTADIELNFISETFKNNLKFVYDDQPNVFIPFPTSSAWDGQIYEVNWIGEWNFIQPAANNYDKAGWKGEIKIRETPL